MECKWWHWSDHLHTDLHYMDQVAALTASLGARSLTKLIYSHHRELCQYIPRIGHYWGFGGSAQCMLHHAPICTWFCPWDIYNLCWSTPLDSSPRMCQICLALHQRLYCMWPSHITWASLILTDQGVNLWGVGLALCKAQSCWPHLMHFSPE